MTILSYSRLHVKFVYLSPVAAYRSPALLTQATGVIIQHKSTLSIMPIIFTFYYAVLTDDYHIYHSREDPFIKVPFTDEWHRRGGAGRSCDPRTDAKREAQDFVRICPQRFRTQLASRQLRPVHTTQWPTLNTYVCALLSLYTAAPLEQLLTLISQNAEEAAGMR